MNCRISPTTGHVEFDGAALPLPHKTQQVLQMIVEAAPAVVSRDDIIDALWPACYSTGDKGLRQAIWTIRSALGDSAGKPRFIRTVPRSGYQWTGPLPIEAEVTVQGPDPVNRNGWQTAARHLPTGLLSLALALGLSATDPAPMPSATASSPPQGSPANHTPDTKVAGFFVRGQSVIVDLDSGCRAILKSDSSPLAGEPVISGDSSSIMIPVITDKSCQLLMFEAGSKRVTRFGACPGIEDQPGADPFKAKKTI